MRFEATFDLPHVLRILVDFEPVDTDRDWENAKGVSVFVKGERAMLRGEAAAEDSLKEENFLAKRLSPDMRPRIMQKKHADTHLLHTLMLNVQDSNEVGNLSCESTA